MSKIIEGKKDAQGLKIGIVVSRYNHFITEKLLDGALDGFKSHGGDDDNVTIVRVPGAFEIPLIADKMAASGRYDAPGLLGGGDSRRYTAFRLCFDAVTRGIGAAVQAHKIPIGFGVLTTNDVQQAMERSGAKDANKGYEALLTVVEMISVLRQLA